MTVDWDKMHMRFTQNDSKVKLQGDPKLMRAIVFLRSLAKTADIEFGGVLWSMSKSWDTNEWQVTSGLQSSELESVLSGYANVFEPPSCLPPKRSQDHDIRIKDGCGSVQVRPYRYAHNQKDKIEKMVTEMIASQVIQPSNSPNSSTVKLVKKK